MTHILRMREPALLVDPINADRCATCDRGRVRCADNPHCCRSTGRSRRASSTHPGPRALQKAPVLTHNNFATNAINLNACWQITQRRPVPSRAAAVPRARARQRPALLACSPAAACGSWSASISSKAARRFLDFRPTLFFGVPTIYVRLLDLPEQPPARSADSCGCSSPGSAPLPAQVLEDFRSRFGHTILERYGMTETLMNISNPYVGRAPPGSVGFPLPGVSVQIRDRRTLRQRTERLRRLLAPRRSYASGVRRWLLPDRRHRRAFGRRILHVEGSPQRCHHLRRFQHLPSRDRGVPSGTGGGHRSRRRRECPTTFAAKFRSLMSSAGPISILRRSNARCRAAFASFKVPRSFVRVANRCRAPLSAKFRNIFCPHDESRT